MSWRDNRLPASFRGAAFVVDTDSQPAGQRTQVHEYPQRDNPGVEFLGKKTGEIKMTGFVGGADCLQLRDALLDAIDKPEPGELVHPWRGNLTVSVIDCNYSHSRAELGVVRFDFVFVEDTGNQAYPSSRRNLSSSLLASADEMDFSAAERFLEIVSRIDLSKLKIPTLQQCIGGAFVLIGAASPALAKLLRSGVQVVSSFLGDPARFQLDLFANFRSEDRQFSGFNARGSGVASLSTVSDKAQALVQLGTVQRPRDEQNRRAANALISLMQDALASDMVRDLAAMPSSARPVPPSGTPGIDTMDQSHDVGMSDASGVPVLALGARHDEQVPVASDVLVARETLTEAMWLLSEGAPPDHFEAISQSRALASTHLVNIARQGSKLISVRSSSLQPALVLAHRRYADATRAGEIVLRNRVPHPGFLPGTELQLLKD